MIRHLGIWTLSLIAASGLLVDSVSATVLLSDSFNRTTGSGDGNGNPAGSGNGLSDWGSNDNALGGSNVQAYTFGQGRAGGANQTTNGSVAQLIAGAAQVELDFAALSGGAGGFIVEFDFQRVALGMNGFLTMAIGVDDTDQIENQGGFNGNTFIFTNSANGADAAVLVKQNGDLELWDGGDAPAQTLGGFFTGADDPHSAVVTVAAPNGFGAGALGAIGVSIDGSPAATQPITFDGVSSGYLSFYSNLAGNAGAPKFGAIDNLVVRAIPEPTAAGLAGLLGVLALVTRSSRKR